MKKPAVHKYYGLGFGDKANKILIAFVFAYYLRRLIAIILSNNLYSLDIQTL